MVDNLSSDDGKGTLMLLAQALSLATNLALALRLLKPSAKPSTAHPASNPSVAPTDQPLPKPAPGVAQKTQPTTTLPTPLHWHALQHEDQRQYVANLRAAGCPEPAIRDLVAAELCHQFAPKAAAIWRPKLVEYWQKLEFEPATPNQLQQLKALHQELNDALHELTGASLHEQQLIDLLNLQLHGTELELLFLPQDKHRAAMTALTDAHFIEREREQHNIPSHHRSEREKELFEEKLRLLSGILTASELEEYRLRHSPLAQSLRQEVQYLDCTVSEFRQLFDAREQAGSTIPTGNLLDRGPATEQVRQIFGDARAKAFEKLSDIYYQGARRAVDQAGLPVDRADRAWQINLDTRAALDRLARDSTPPLEERKRQLTELRAKAERQLNELLGEKIARAVRRDLGVVFHVAESQLKS